MTLSLAQSATAVAAGIQASFLAVSGTAPYTYAVLNGGAGGTINSSTGVYVGPPSVSSVPAQAFDTIKVTDAAAATATAQIMVGTPLLLVCDIIQRGLGLANGRVALWDQKTMKYADSGLYVVVSVPMCRAFANNVTYDGSGNQVASVNMGATLDIDIMSRTSEARDRKEETLLALTSVYAQQQQAANSFYIAPLPASNRFLDLSEADGDAIPYRYKISVNIQYFVTKTSATPYFDNGFTPGVTPNV